MRLIGILFVFFGYVLVYASAAAGGKFATDPWAGLFADAYEDANLQQGLTQAATAAATGGPLPRGFSRLRATPNAG